MISKCIFIGYSTYGMHSCVIMEILSLSNKELLCTEGKRFSGTESFASDKGKFHFRSVMMKSSWQNYLIYKQMNT